MTVEISAHHWLPLIPLVMEWDETAKENPIQAILPASAVVVAVEEVVAAVIALTTHVGPSRYCSALESLFDQEVVFSFPNADDDDDCTAAADAHAEWPLVYQW
jgi:hypothetical protein